MLQLSDSLWENGSVGVKKCQLLLNTVILALFRECTRPHVPRGSHHGGGEDRWGSGAGGSGAAGGGGGGGGAGRGRGKVGQGIQVILYLSISHFKFCVIRK